MSVHAVVIPMLPNLECPYASFGLPYECKDPLS